MKFRPRNMEPPLINLGIPHQENRRLWAQHPGGRMIVRLTDNRVISFLSEEDGLLFIKGQKPGEVLAVQMNKW